MPGIVPNLVSTVIPVHNRSVMLREAVGSVLLQTYRPIEIIIVDDGSTDDTPAVAAALQHTHPGIIRLAQTHNRGAGRARETGRTLALGEFIQYLDSDDLLLPDKFARLVSILQNHPESGAAYGATRLIDSHGHVLACPYKWTGQPRETLFPGLLVDRWWNTHTPLWRRSVCEHIGPWTDMRIMEDWEYEARAAGLGVRLAHCTEPLSDTRQHETARLTGRRPSVALAGAVARLIVTLDQQATLAQVASECPEMRHFARWAFLAARQAAAHGLIDAARTTMIIARRRAQAASLPARDMALYTAVARLIGWQTAGRLSTWFDAHLKRSPGMHTQPSARAAT